eukprot:scaffold666801_cov38-Prasinocladus_malaysianus.AAC.1
MGGYYGSACSVNWQELDEYTNAFRWPFVHCISPWHLLVYPLATVFSQHTPPYQPKHVPKTGVLQLCVIAIAGWRQLL